MSLLSLLDGNETLLLDGAMGTQLAQLCGEGGGHLSVTHPEKVMEIHRRYLESGSRIIITNTLTMNRLYIETHGLSVDVQEVNHTAARLARSVTSDEHYVLGDMSSTGKLLAPYGDYSEQQFIDVYEEQAHYLAEGGVDGFIIETLSDLREALCAVMACRAVSTLPVAATIAFSTATKGGRTFMGNTALDCARQLADAGVQALGANCGDIDPYQMADLLDMFSEATSLPIIAQPNAGKPRLEQGKTLFDMGPDEFAAGIKECIAHGARLVGGCCGTTPEHIRAVQRIL
jgi:5-methyltetrahydrofolate--homocysteine methyltransferase